MRSEVAMPVYTRTGDKGETGLMGGARVSKDHARVVALGEVDELNAAVGVALADVGDADLRALLEQIQERLFIVGAEVGAAEGQVPPKRIGSEHVKELEEASDALEKEVGPQRAFVLPRGTKAAASLHLARAVTRRAERAAVALSRQESLNPEVLRYLNRLSTLLHVMALAVNRRAKVEDRHPSYR